MDASQGGEANHLDVAPSQLLQPLMAPMYSYGEVQAGIPKLLQYCGHAHVAWIWPTYRSPYRVNQERLLHHGSHDVHDRYRPSLQLRTVID